MNSSLALDVLPIMDSRTSDRKNFNACVLSLLPSATHLFRSLPICFFSLCYRLLNERRLMEMAFVPVNLYILFFWLLLDQRSAGDPSFLLCRGSCILTSTYVESTFQGRQELAEGSSVVFHFTSNFLSLFLISIYVVFSPLHQAGGSIQCIVRSLHSCLLASTHALHSARLPFHLPFFNGRGRTLLPLR